MSVPATLPEPPAPTPQQRHPEAEPPDLNAVLSHCRYCYGYHPGVCPKVRIIEWHPTGQIARIVLNDRPDQENAVVYPEGDEEAESK